MAKKIYAAGFDLFAADGAARCRAIHQLCLDYGLDPYVPGYSPGSSDNTGGEAALTDREIFAINTAHIDDSDVVMANLNPFRGCEPDGGTAFEVGYAYAKGITVYSYVADARPMTELLGGPVDENGYRVEDFGSPLNLMLSCSSKVVQGTAADCLAAMRADGVI